MSVPGCLTPQLVCRISRLSSATAKSDVVRARTCSRTLHTRRRTTIHDITRTPRHTRQFSTTRAHPIYATSSLSSPAPISDRSRKSNISEASLAHVEAARTKWQDTLPEGHLSPADQRLWDTLYGSPRRLWNQDETQQIEEMMQEGILLEEAMMVIEGVDVTEKESGYTVTDGVVEYHGPVDEQGRPIRTEEEDAGEEDGKVHAMEEHDGDEEFEIDDFALEQEQEIPHSQQILQDAIKAGATDLEQSDYYVRTHPLTKRGRFATLPSTLLYPKELQSITREILKEKTKIAHLKERGFKYMAPPLLGPSQKRSSQNRYHPNLQAELNRMDQLDAAVWLGVCLPDMYAINMGVATELRRRMGGDWALGVKKVLDIGGGGAGIIAWGDVVKAEEMARSEAAQAQEAEEEQLDDREEIDLDDEPQTERNRSEAAFGKEPSDTWDWGHGVEGIRASSVDGDYKFEATVVTASPQMRHHASKILHNTTFLPRTPYFQAPPNSVRWETTEADELFDIENPKANAGFDEKKQPPVRPKRQYDLIFATYTLHTKDKKDTFNHHVDNLWRLLNPGGVLCVVELGDATGFAAVAQARERLLKRWIKSPMSMKKKNEIIHEPQDEENDVDAPVHDDNVFEFLQQKGKPVIKKSKSEELEDGMIIAPCTNHEPCPMYTNVKTIFKKGIDVCRFFQRYKRSPVQERVLSYRKAGDHANAYFSYVAVRRGIAKEETVVLLPAKAKKDSQSRTRRLQDLNKVEEELSEHQKRVFMHHQPRLILPPIKSHHHVLLDVCTSDGTLERWTVPKSYGNEAYRDARKARLGDMWVHGAKTKVLRQQKKKTRYQVELAKDGMENKMRKLQARDARREGWSLKPGQRKGKQFRKMLSEHDKPRFKFHE